jgi:hypothetical protein
MDDIEETVTGFINGLSNSFNDLPGSSTVISHLYMVIAGDDGFFAWQAQAVMWSFAVLLNFLSERLYPWIFSRVGCKVFELMPFAAFSYIRLNYI